MSSIELKPCPFCGGEAYLEEYNFKDDSGFRNQPYKISHKIGCKSCDIFFLEFSEFSVVQGQMEFIKNGFEKCLEEWNRRADNA